jgi:signal transduction histidine kinase
MDLRESTRKLELLTGITRHDILNQLTTLSGFVELARHCSDEAELHEVIGHQEEIIRRIEENILFSRNYQNIGNSAPQWQSLSRVMERISEGMIETDGIIYRSLGTVEVFADPLLPKVFFNIIENSFRHGGAVNRIDIRYEKTPRGCTITFEDDGCGVSRGEKELIFQQGYGKNTGLGLFLSREILRITDIGIRETGIPGRGARFELTVPASNMRDPGQKP